MQGGSCKEYIKLKTGYRTALMDGMLVPESPLHMATEGFYHAVPGSRLHLCEEGYLFAVAIYDLERREEYIYSYDYQKEQNWTTYTQNLTPQTYQSSDYVFDKECYFRVCVRRSNGANLNAEDNDKAAKMIEYYHEEPEYVEKLWFEREIQKSVKTIRECESEDTLKICLLADTHYTVNGTWQDTVANIGKVSARVAFDAIVHLGDMTDGMVSKELTREYVEKMICNLKRCNIPLYITLGNHDSNYFRNRENAFNRKEMQELYRLPGEALDYYIDLQKYAVRMIFLSSFDDSEPIRYGYTEEQLKWLKETLFQAPEGTKFLVFSHDAPLAELDYWSFLIRNGEALLDILEECNNSEKYQIVGFFYGHVHADAYFDECSFPIISIGCTKLEEFYDKKPAGAVTWSRKEDDVTQDLWDSLLVDFEKQQLKLVRFGAGEDREFSFAKKECVYKKHIYAKRQERNMKIWAHRGASAHAPENTLPAFHLAYELNADGIELDVQLTKDGIPVVIHDETVDRVSDGNGWVKDYTLAEIKQLNVSKRFPAYGNVEIPTLEEVYDFVKTTDMTVNVELKNSVVPYINLEEKVLEIAEQKGIADRIVYSSFNHYSMKRVKELQPNVKVAFLYADGIMDIAEYAEKYNVYAVHPSMCNMKFADIVQECHAKGVRVHVWTVNEEADFEEMRKMGVDAVITNYAERG
uniref:glycerophosphodiester phosphodiesterase family protein n=1 Tax=Acetatifactor sp. TaxID=1872090 RepID=UPI0040559FD6